MDQYSCRTNSTIRIRTPVWGAARAMGPCLPDLTWVDESDWIEVLCKACLKQALGFKGGDSPIWVLQKISGRAGKQQSPRPLLFINFILPSHWKLPSCIHDSHISKTICSLKHFKDGKVKNVSKASQPFRRASKSEPP